MTIVEALKIVMEKHPQGMTNKEAYEEIVKLNLYEFSGKNPSAIVNGIIRRHCYGLDFPTANPVKHFKIVGYRGKKALYTLANMNGISSKAVSKKIVDEEVLPEEKIQKYYNEHLENIYSQLIDNIMEKMPVFFERLIVDLLLKMGYGYDDRSGIIVGGSHDNGIDGVINEDKLGLSVIYLQAKRYAQKNSKRQIASTFSKPPYVR